MKKLILAIIIAISTGLVFIFIKFPVIKASKELDNNIKAYENFVAALPQKNKKENDCGTSEYIMLKNDYNEGCGVFIPSSRQIKIDDKITEIIIGNNRYCKKHTIPKTDALFSKCYEEMKKTNFKVLFGK